MMRKPSVGLALGVGAAQPALAQALRRALVALALALPLGAPAGAAVLPFEASVSYLIGPSIPPLTLHGSGVGTSDAPGGVFSVPAGAFAGNPKVFVPISPTFIGLQNISVPANSVNNPAGSFTSAGGAWALAATAFFNGGAGGQLQLWRIGGGAIITENPPPVRVVSQTWKYSANTIFTAMGAALANALSASATAFDNRTANGAGTVQLVAPAYALIGGGALGNVPIFGVLTIAYTPEPGTLVLLGTGVALLAIHGRRKLVKRMRLAIAAAVVLAFAAPAPGAVLPLTATYRVEITLFGTITLTGSGIGASDGIGGSSSIPANVFSPNAKVVVPISPTFLFTELSVPANSVGNPAATLAPGGPLALSGSIFFGPPAPLSFIALSPIGGGGNWSFCGVAFCSPFKVGGSTWIHAQSKIFTTMGVALANAVTATATAYDNRTAAGVGTVQLVAPGHMTISSGALGNVPIIGTLTLTYTPEPGTLVLLGTGVALLGIAGRRARERR